MNTFQMWTFMLTMYNIWKSIKCETYVKLADCWVIGRVSVPIGTLRHTVIVINVIEMWVSKKVHTFIVHLSGSETVVLLATDPIKNIP